MTEIADIKSLRGSAEKDKEIKDSTEDDEKSEGDKCPSIRTFDLIGVNLLDWS